MKWWAQSFLGGIPRIVVGLRSDDGIVTDITSYNTQTLHRGVSFIVKLFLNPQFENV